MHAINTYYFLAFGAVSLLLGILAFVKAKSKASLIAGGISGILLLIGGFLLLQGKHTPGILVAGIVSFLLAGRFVPAFIKTKSFYPAGLFAILSVIGVVLAILDFV